MNPASPFRVLIVEDQIDQRQELEEFFQQQPNFTVIGACGTVNNARSLIHYELPQLVLLDIMLPDGTGFDLLDHTFPPYIKVIFLTAHIGQDYFIRAIRCGAIDYLLKPFDELELKEALQRVIGAQPLLRDQIDIAKQSLNKFMRQDRIALRSQQIVEIVEVKEICYLQGDNRHTTVFLNGGKKVITNKTLKEYEELLSGDNFLRIHYSYLVNERHIQRYHQKDGLLFLKDGTEIPVSDRRKGIIDSYYKIS